MKKRNLLAKIFLGFFVICLFSCLSDNVTNKDLSLNNKITKNGTEMLYTSEAVVLSKPEVVDVANENGVFIAGRTIELFPFAMGQYEVTQELFEEIMGVNPSYYQDGDNSKHQPVENICWYEAIAFCNKLSAYYDLELCYSVEGISDWQNLEHKDIPKSYNTKWDNCVLNMKANGYRLPIEAEWEFAARGGENAGKKDWTFRYSGSNDIDKVAVYDTEGGAKNCGLKKPNKANLFDMSGNVWEWCWDWYSKLNTSTPDTGASSSSSVIRELRGGSWHSVSSYCTVSTRFSSYPHGRNSYYGFRIARSIM